MTKRILMIAYHYPPIGLSSGVHRTLKFSQYLLSHNWQPIVLSVVPKAYERTSEYQLKDIPSSIKVKRAFALDTAKHLSVKGRYLDVLALPDRWVSWVVGGSWAGMNIIRRHKPDIIWSTYPIASALLIGLVLHRLSGVPWIVDFRDSMTDDGYPEKGMKRRVYLWIEKKVMKYALKIVFTTQSTLQMYKERYPDVDVEKYCVIENGFDEENFQTVEEDLNRSTDVAPGSVLTLVHSGLLYPSERDPRDFFSAIAELKAENLIGKDSLRVILRASGNEAYFQSLIEDLEINDIIFLENSVPYGEALKEMLLADGLLIFQAANCNHQIPAKVYEYLRARRPIFALTDIKGDTAGVLIRANIDTIAPLDNKSLIKEELLRFMSLIRNKEAPLATDDVVSGHSRLAKTKEFANLLNSIIAR